MKNALALTFLSSMTCLVAWDAEAAVPNAAPEVHHHHHGVRSTSKAEPAKNGHAKAQHHAPKRIAKVDHDKASPALSGAAKADIDLPLHHKPAEKPAAKPAPVKLPKAHAKAIPLSGAASNGGAKIDLKAPVAKKHGPEKSYWLAAEPHVPLAFVSGSDIKSVGDDKSCGGKDRWAKPNSRWNAIDAWGQVTGSHEIKGSDLYDVTHCREVVFKGKTGAEPHVVFVSADSTWRPSPKVEWTPNESELKEFNHFTKTLTSLWINEKPAGKALPQAKQVMFFQVPAAEDKGEHRPTRWAVMGGPILVVAYLGQNDRWKVATVESPLGLANSYHPVGVFDMNGDKIPEIIVHSNDGPTFGESVLSLDPGAMKWTDIAVSPGGGTL